MSETKILKKGPTGRYGLLQAGYWMDYLVIANFAAVFLTNRGFTTGEIGIITSAGFLLSCVLQQVTGILADKQDKVPLKVIIMGFLAVCMIVFLLLGILPNALWSTAILYLVSAVYYVYAIVGEKDIIKGQTMFGVATSGIVCMLANYLGGVMLEA